MRIIFPALLFFLIENFLLCSSTLRRRRGDLSTTVPPLIEVTVPEKSDWLMTQTTSRPALRRNRIDQVVHMSGDFIRETMEKYGIRSNPLPFVREDRVDPYGPFRKFVKTHLLDILVIVGVSVLVMSIAVFFN